ncbi:MAG TPA: tetratricopeptide repeat protein [Bryobacteraceae bacterium]|nr:tetratricopeptide repeat protein [Bryobacteraceae bacterium]
MFQELLIADLVVADLTIENPNVWYELGVRHALRARGIIIVCGGRVTSAFDLYTDRKLRYALKDGAPDPAYLDQDKRRLADMVKATMDAWHGRKISPVYSLMPNLQEPDWKSLKIGAAREFWERHEVWERRIDLARKTGRIGDLLVLANEAPISAFRVDAWVTAGKALRKAGRFQFALEHLEHGLDRDPNNLDVLREMGICLQRLAIVGAAGHSLERARQHYRAALDIFPRDAETWALLGRVDKDAWTAAWDRPGQTPAQKREGAAYEDALLRAAIDSYSRAYRTSPGHYYSGINALTLMHLYRHLTGDQRYDTDMETMAGAVRFAAGCECDPTQVFWAKATMGDLEILVGTPRTVTDAYKDESLSAGAEDLALCQAAAGGDQLFLEACQKRGVRCQILLPLPEPEFIERSILPSARGDTWRERYFKLKERLEDPIRVMPDELGALPSGVDPFERCNLWLLYTTLAWGIEKARFVCLWNGGGGDGPGGTEQMYNEVKKRTGQVTWIDTRKLWGV